MSGVRRALRALVHAEVTRRSLVGPEAVRASDIAVIWVGDDLYEELLLDSDPDERFTMTEPYMLEQRFTGIPLRIDPRMTNGVRFEWRNGDPGLRIQLDVPEQREGS